MGAGLKEKILFFVFTIPPLNNVQRERESELSGEKEMEKEGKKKRNIPRSYARVMAFMFFHITSHGDHF